MARGTLSGVVTGVVVAVVGLGVAAVLIDPVELRTETPGAGSETGTEAVAPAPEVASPVADAAEPDAPATVEPEVADAPDSTAPQDADEPETAAPEPEMAATPEPEIAASETANGDEALDAPTRDTEGAPVTETADTPETGDEVDSLASEEEVASADMAQPDEDAAPEAATGSPSETAPGAQTEATQTEAAPSETPQSGTAQPPMVVAPADPPRPEVTLPESDGTMRAAGQSSFDPPPLEDEDTLEDPAPSASVVTGRLPTIGESVAEEAAVDAGPQPPIKANAVPYTPAADLPEMSVLLLDTGPQRSEVGDLAVMPFPMSVAVDASAPDAEEAIAFYRANGAEVVLIVPLPERATAMDVDVTFQAYGALLSDVVAVMFPPEAGFQGLGDAAAQVVTNLEERGLGLVTYPEGLNTGHKLAVKDDVPAGLVFRDLDGAGQTGDVIRRFLDNVAFRARNDEGVIAIARVRPESIQALLEWSLGSRAQSVNFAPVSSVLLND